jgi:hypothetical protein
MSVSPWMHHPRATTAELHGVIVPVRRGGRAGPSLVIAPRLAAVIQALRPLARESHPADAAPILASAVRNLELFEHVMRARATKNRGHLLIG